MDVDTMLWSQTPAFLNPGRLQEADLVVAELFRRYPNGRRAEAVVLAERCAGTPPVLVIAAACDAVEIGCPGYWDLASPDTIRTRVEILLRRPDRAMAQFEELKRSVQAYWEVPKQH